MMTNALDPLVELFDRHEELGYGSRDIAAGAALSGWQCINPYARRLQRASVRAAKAVDRVAYSYLEDDPDLQAAIAELHLRLDGVAPSAVHPGAGANTLLFAFAVHLKSLGTEEVFFVPPLYHALRYALKLLDIRARPVSAFHAFEPQFSVRLPDRKTYLLLADPVWYAGMRVPAQTIEDVNAWQLSTGSTVLVDGSFQYMPWDGRVEEATAKLPADLTFRIISPTKALAMHGYRFAYMLLPAARQRKFSEAYNNVFASASAETRPFAHLAITEMGKRAMTNKLMALARRRNASLRESGATRSVLKPECGYFVFEELRVKIEAPGLMDGAFFEQHRYPGYVRLNLLSPSLGLLLGSDQRHL